MKELIEKALYVIGKGVAFIGLGIGTIVYAIITALIEIWQLGKKYRGKPDNFGDATTRWLEWMDTFWSKWYRW